MSATIEAAAIESPAVIQAIPLSLIDPAPYNRKCHDDENKIAELAQSILINGLINPANVRPRADGRYELICGERRYRAHLLLDRTTMDCTVMDLDDREAKIRNIVENHHRRDPEPMEEAQAVKDLLEIFDGNFGMVCDALGKSDTWVRRRSRLPGIVDEWKEEIYTPNSPYADYAVTIGKLEEIAVLPPALQKRLLADGVLRYEKTIPQMRKAIERYFRNLAEKPWSRAWEKKYISSAKRCDACLNRSDRDGVLFFDPNVKTSGDKMCLDPICWQSKCVQYGAYLRQENPLIVPVRDRYFDTDKTDEIAALFGCEVRQNYDAFPRGENETEREGYLPMLAYVVDGANVGATRPVWVRAPKDTSEDSTTAATSDSGAEDASNDQTEPNFHELLTEAREAAERMVHEYLNDLETYSPKPSRVLDTQKLRAIVWFGIDDSISDGITIDDPTWNPIKTAWQYTAEHVAYCASLAVVQKVASFMGINSTYEMNAELAAALSSMFDIPVELITTWIIGAFERKEPETDFILSDADPITLDTLYPFAVATTEKGEISPL